MSETTGPPPIDLAYVAGYMDGEGCFRANKGNLAISITNTYPHILNDIQQLFGGRVHMKKRQGNGRTTFSFDIYGESAREMARLLLPHLKEKKAQAELVLELSDYPKHSSKKEFIVRKLKELKRVDYGR